MINQALAIGVKALIGLKVYRPGNASFEPNVNG
jgi:hypothetical protein